MGIILGHLLTPESTGPALGGITSMFALLGGAWGPLAQGGLFLKIVKLLPSYWLVDAGRTAYAGHAWTSEGWLVIVVWTLALARIAMLAYRRDTSRV